MSLAESFGRVELEFAAIARASVASIFDGRVRVGAKAKVIHALIQGLLIGKQAPIFHGHPLDDLLIYR